MRKKFTMLLAALFLVMGTSVAQTAVGAIGNPTTTLTDGKYVVVAMSDKGSGPCYYQESGNERHYRYDLNKSIKPGKVVTSDYVWTIDETTEGDVQHITITNLADETKFFVKDNAIGKNFSGTERASLKVEKKTITGNDYIALTLDDANVGYIHINKPVGSNPNLSYWNAYGDNGSCAKFVFYPVVTYTIDALTGEGIDSGWKKEWTYTATEINPVSLKLKCNYNNMTTTGDGLLDLYVGQHAATTYTLEVPNKHKIVSYSFDFVKANDYSDAVTLTVDGQNYAPTAEMQHIAVNDVDASSTTFTMTGANKGIKVSNFNVVVDWAVGIADEVNAPNERKSSFAVGDEMYIYSTCRVNGTTDWTGFFTNNNGSASLITEKPTNLFTEDNNPIWIISSLETLQTADATPKTYYKVTLRNKATNGYLGIGGVTTNNSAGAPQTFYISQWKNHVFANANGVMPGDDVWSENTDGTALEQADIKDDDPIWVVQAENGKCFNTDGRAYKGDKDVAYPIVFYSVRDAKAELVQKYVDKIAEVNTAITSAESLFSTAEFVATPVALQVTQAAAAGYIKCNNLDPDEGNDMNYLIDNNPSTYIHSNWHTISSEKDYLEVYLGEGKGMSLFYFTEITRGDASSDFPSSIEILGSEDGNSFESITIVSGLPTAKTKSYTSPLIQSDSKYKYLRFVVTGSSYAADRPYFHMAEFDLYAVTINEEYVSRGTIFCALNEAIPNGEKAIADLNLGAMNSAKTAMDELIAEGSVTYPFTLTTDDENPVLYAIKSGRTDRSQGWWYTYDPSDQKIGLTQFTMANTQFWYFKEIVKNNKVYLQLYPAAGEGKAMSYNNTNNTAGNVIAKDVNNTENYKSTWLLEVVNGKYGLQTEGRENRLSNNGGVVDNGVLTNNKMGMWNDGPNNDAGTAMYLFEKPKYPFALTTNDADPQYCGIKSGRDTDGQEWWYTYITEGEDAGKILLSAYTGAKNQMWYFKEVASDKNAFGLQLYPAAGEGKAMSYQNTNNDPDKIFAQSIGAEGWNSTWILETTNGTQPYGLQTEGKENRLSNNGGVSKKMGMWNAAPKDDSGSAMYFSDPVATLQALIDEAKAKAVSDHDGEVGYFSVETAETLRAAIAQAETNKANKNYELTALKNALTSVSLILPEAGKYYQIKSANPSFFAKQGKEMCIYSSNASGQLEWKALDAADKSFYWTITPKNGKFVFKNEADGKYVPAIAGDAYAMTETESDAAEFTLTWLAPGQFNINGNGTMHMAGHSEGAGSGDRICSWDGGINSSSAWTIVEVEHPDLSEAKERLKSLMDELYDPWASPMPLQVDDAAAGYYLSSCGFADGNAEANMIDGKKETFYGSPWAGHVNGIDYHYWQVDLGEGVTWKDFVFSYTTRADGNDMPTEIIVKGSADGVKFDEITTISEGLPDGASEEYCSKAIVPTADNYRYVRFEVTGTNNNYKPGSHATQRTISIAEFAMWQYKHLFDAAQAAIDNKAATLDEVNQAYLNLKMMNVEKPTYPFTVTTDDENPVLYAIKSGRTNDGKEWWYTYDSEDGKIALSQYAGSDNQFWFFKEVITDDYQYALRLYPYIDKTKAMSYENTNNGAGKIIAQTPGTTGWTNLWLSVSTEGTAPYGLQTFDKKNYLSNNGGVGYKMGMWNAAPNADGGTAMYFYTPAEALQGLIAQAEVLALSGHDDEVGYYSSATVNALRAAIAQAEANLENKVYSVTELNTAIANLSVILPQAGKYYQIKSAKPEFYEKHQKEMAIYSDATSGKLSWKALDATDKSFYWTMTPNAEGTSFTVQNAGDNKYVPAVITEEGDANKDKYIMTSEPESAQGFTLKLLTLGQFNIIGGGTMHALGHGGGANTSGDICSHDGGINSPSAWTIVEVEHPDLAVAKINLQAKIDELKPIVEYSGSNPGCYKEAEVAKFADMFAAAEEVMKGGSSESNAYVEALEDLNKAVVDLDLEVIPVTAGLYRIVSASSSFTEDKGITAYAYDGYYREHRYPGWAPVDENDPLQYWLLEDNGDGTFNLKAAYEGNYMTTATSMSETAKAVTFTALGKAQFNIRLAGDSDPLHCNGWNWGHPSAPLTTWGGGVDSNSSWRLVAVTEKPTFTYDLTVGSVGYATLMLGFDAEIPDGVTCYAVKVNAAESGADLSAITGGVLPANTPVIVTAADKTYTFASTDKVATAPKANELMGTLYPKIITPETGYTCYVLANPKDKDTGEFKGVGLYKASLNKNENTAFLNNANKVYLPVPVVDAKAPRALMFRFGGTTEIELPTANGQQPTAVYDLQGRRVLNPTKGMYIINGKKVVIR